INSFIAKQNKPYLIEQRCRKLAVRTLEGWIPKAGNAPLAGVIHKRAAAGPLVRQPRRRKKQAICNIPNPQA
ncbi:MAG: hypothetical protein IKZ41_01330, partial [Clostridia bacterium]|nr:hypothetical protein [Clostridia bacterium]